MPAEDPHRAPGEELTASPPDPTAARGALFLRIAWDTVARAVGRRLPVEASPGTGLDPLRRHGATFVSLHRVHPDGRRELRGCLGSLEPARSLLDDVRWNAAAVVRSDPRFPTVQAAELDDLELEVTELGELVPIVARDRNELCDRLRPGVDGLLIRFGEHRATFLPQVWGDSDADEFVSALLEKSGLPRAFWSPELAVWIYPARSWSSSWPGARTLP